MRKGSMRCQERLQSGKGRPQKKIIQEIEDQKEDIMADVQDQKFLQYSRNFQNLVVEKKQYRDCVISPSSIPCGPRLDPSWAQLGPGWPPVGPDWGPFGNAAWVTLQ